MTEFGNTKGKSGHQTTTMERKSICTKGQSPTRTCSADSTQPRKTRRGNGWKATTGTKIEWLERIVEQINLNLINISFLKHEERFLKFFQSASNILLRLLLDIIILFYYVQFSNFGSGPTSLAFSNQRSQPSVHPLSGFQVLYLWHPIKLKHYVCRLLSFWRIFGSSSHRSHTLIV